MTVILIIIIIVVVIRSNNSKFLILLLLLLPLLPNSVYLFVQQRDKQLRLVAEDCASIHRQGIEKESTILQKCKIEKVYWLQENEGIRLQNCKKNYFKGLEGNKLASSVDAIAISKI